MFSFRIAKTVIIISSCATRKSIDIDDRLFCTYFLLHFVSTNAFSSACRWSCHFSVRCSASLFKLIGSLFLNDRWAVARVECGRRRRAIIFRVFNFFFFFIRRLFLLLHRLNGASPKTFSFISSCAARQSFFYSLAAILLFSIRLWFMVCLICHKLHFIFIAIDEMVLSYAYIGRWSIDFSFGVDQRQRKQWNGKFNTDLIIKSFCLREHHLVASNNFSLCR